MPLRWKSRNWPRPLSTQTGRLNRVSSAGVRIAIGNGGVTSMSGMSASVCIRDAVGAVLARRAHDPEIEAVARVAEEFVRQVAVAGVAPIRPERNARDEMGARGVVAAHRDGVAATHQLARLRQRDDAAVPHRWAEEALVDGDAARERISLRQARLEGGHIRGDGTMA